MKRILLSFIFTIVTTITYAQNEGSHTKAEDQHEQSDDEHETKYKIAFTVGATHIPAAFEQGNGEDAVFVPTLGLDFFYHINHNWSLGIMADLELGDYIVDFGRENLYRENALILALMAGYEVKPHWEILFGGGIEIESHKNLAVLRAGTEYEFPMANNWNIAPSFFYDFKEEFNTWALAIGVSKRL
jgi:hypothetical protein